MIRDVWYELTVMAIAAAIVLAGLVAIWVLVALWVTGP